MTLATVVGCGHRQPVAAAPPPLPPAIRSSEPPPYKTFPPSAPGTPAVSARSASPITPGVVSSDSPEDLAFVQSHQPIWSQTGVASWYGPPYDRHPGANGQVFDQNMLSAAHRELPMGSLLRVTNLRNGQASVMRVTDRGPFVPGRVLDLSVASAKAIGVWAPGTATVQIEVFAAPKSIADGGRWCVQIGAFHDESKAFALQHSLQRRYSTANVIEFTGPTGHWVRIRPLGDDKARAQEIESSVQPEQGAAYLTRLD
ncbi:SPOR domain-containing protein [Acidipila sp. EB88]|nr:SPOR domain-containing protein [Acidipila sp. EB88]